MRFANNRINNSGVELKEFQN